MVEVGRSTWIRYIVATWCVFLALVAPYRISDLLGPWGPMQLQVLAVAVAAYYGGLGPGLFAVILGAVVGEVLYKKVWTAYAYNDPTTLAYMVVHLLVSLAICALSISRDLAYRRADEVISGRQESDRRFHAMFDLAAIGMAQLNPQGRFIEVNHYLSQVLGRGPVDLFQRTIFDLAHPDDAARLKAGFDGFMADPGRVFEHELRCLRPDGAAVPIRMSLSVIRDSLGEARFCIAVFDDTSARHRS